MALGLDRFADRTNDEWIEKDLRYLEHPEAPSTGDRLIVVSGRGSTLVGADGREYLDMHAGAWLVQVGHGRTEVANAVQEQLSDFAHFSLMLGVTNKPAIALAERLVSFAPEGYGRVRFSTSGSEADDEAFQLVRFYHAVKGRPSRTKVISLQGGYHGRTVVGRGLEKHDSGVRSPLEDLVVQVPAPTPYRNECPEGEDLVDFCVAELERTIAEIGAENIAAMFGELVQGPAGMTPLPQEYWQRVERILRDNGILLVIDEVVTGMGRSGEWLLSTTWGLRPDVIVVAKGIASGYMPISALLLTNEFADAVEELRGGGSYGGHAASCIAALVSLDIIEQEGLLENARERGEQFRRELRALADEIELIGDVHGAGLMIGLTLVTDRETKAPLLGLDEALMLAIREDYGVILHGWGGTMIMTPPLVITAEEVTRAVQAIGAALRRVRPDGTLAPVG